VPSRRPSSTTQTGSASIPDSQMLSAGDSPSQEGALVWDIQRDGQRNRRREDPCRPYSLSRDGRSGPPAEGQSPVVPSVSSRRRDSPLGLGFPQTGTHISDQFVESGFCPSNLHVSWDLS